MDPKDQLLRRMLPTLTQFIRDFGRGEFSARGAGMPSQVAQEDRLWRTELGFDVQVCVDVVILNSLCIQNLMLRE